MRKHRAKREKLGQGKPKPKPTKKSRPPIKRRNVQQGKPMNEDVQQVQQGEPKVPVSKIKELGAERGTAGNGDAGGGEPSSTPPVAAYKKGLKHRPRYTELEKSRLKAMVVKAMEKAFTVGVAAKAVGIARSTVIAWQDQDPEFKAQCEDSMETRLDRLEDRVITEAHRLKQPHHMTGCMFMLNGYRRERFMPMTRHEHVGVGGGPILVAVAAKIQKMSTEELRLELAKLLQPTIVNSVENKG